MIDSFFFHSTCIHVYNRCFWTLCQISRNGAAVAELIREAILCGEFAEGNDYRKIREGRAALRLYLACPKNDRSAADKEREQRVPGQENLEKIVVNLLGIA
jgi:hypothetical protein